MTELSRRLLLGSMAVAATAASAGVAQAAKSEPPTAPGGKLAALTAQLASLPRRRMFKDVPMILDSPEQWDHEALDAVIAFGGDRKQVWDNTDIAGPWLNLMRNALNAQVWSFRHPDFLVVSATHGSAHLALYDQAIWDKYKLTTLAGAKFPSNTLIMEKPGAKADARNYEDPKGMFSPDNNSIPALQRRGVVFLSCHNAIWEQAGALIAAGNNPDNASHETLTAELTNHLLPGVVLTPGAVATLPELQRTGFHYAK